MVRLVRCRVTVVFRIMILRVVTVWVVLRRVWLPWGLVLLLVV